MIMVKVTDTSGAEVQVEVEAGAALMEPLRDWNMVLGTCGGMVSCGTCHVYVIEGSEGIDPAGEDERDMLEALADIVDIKPNSRLSCQISMRADLNQLHVEIGPQF